MDRRLLCFHHFKAIMRTETRAHSAMTTDDGFLCLLVKIDGPHDADIFAFTAAYALFGFHNNAAARSFLKRVSRAHFHTRRLQAAKAHNRDKVTGHAACCTYLDRAFDKRMILLINRRTDIHARKTAETLIHIFWLKYFGQLILRY